MGCCLTSCTSNYHFMCSRAKNCVFLEDKKVYCHRHRDLIKGEVRPLGLAGGSPLLSPCAWMEAAWPCSLCLLQVVPEKGFEVLRRVFVDFEGINLRRRFLNGLEPENIHMMIGKDRAWPLAPLKSLCLSSSS